MVRTPSRHELAIACAGLLLVGPVAFCVESHAAFGSRPGGAAENEAEAGRPLVSERVIVFGDAERPYRSLPRNDSVVVGLRQDVAGKALDRSRVRPCAHDRAVQPIICYQMIDPKVLRLRDTEQRREAWAYAAHREANARLGCVTRQEMLLLGWNDRQLRDYERPARETAQRLEEAAL